MIIIPDVHGRTFWKQAVERIDTDTIVFLGDYLDPYPYEFGVVNPWNRYNSDVDRASFNDRMEKFQKDEELLKRNTIDNFKEIIDFKKQHPDNVILLIGNHDCGYAVNYNLCDCRIDMANYREIESLFRDNWDLFQLAYEADVNEKHYVFSHAGINRSYTMQCFGEIDEIELVETFNKPWRERDVKVLKKILGMTSPYRGGFDQYGSIVWADVNEFAQGTGYSFFQIFGHTQQESAPIFEETYACLDVRKAFELTSDGKLRELC